jgi:hypothetical protein
MTRPGPGFTLSFARDDPPSPQYPEGYWHAVTNDGGYDGVGTSPETALADLVNALAKATDDRLEAQ